jgi:hypothetical protein
MTIAYRNEVLGDQGTKCVPVDVLPESEQSAKSKAEVNFALIGLHEQILTELKTEREKIQHDCPHHYFNDEPGFMYDVRTCNICGTSMGLI